MGFMKAFKSAKKLVGKGNQFFKTGVGKKVGGMIKQLASKAGPKAVAALQVAERGAKAIDSGEHMGKMKGDIARVAQQKAGNLASKFGSRADEYSRNHSYLRHARDPAKRLMNQYGGDLRQRGGSFLKNQMSRMRLPPGMY